MDKRALKNSVIKRQRQFLLPLLAGLSLSGGSYAESSKATVADEFVLEVQGHLHEPGHKDHVVSIKAARERWEKERLKQRQVKQGKTAPPNLDWQSREAAKLVFPKPGALDSSDASSFLPRDWLFRLTPVAKLLLPTAAEAAGGYGGISIDGNTNDWTVYDRINWPVDRPPYLASGPEIHARFVPGATPMYVFAIQAPGVAIAPNTTVWLNMDQNPQTGFKIWDAYGGAEYVVNVYSDGVPHLYRVTPDGIFNWVAGLEFATSADKSVLEFAVPAAALGLSAPQAIDVMADINDTIFLPTDYTSGIQYSLTSGVETPPVRTDLSKRVGIVYSEASKNNFYDGKAYSQLYMSMQHQAMMAGIGFDLLNETDLVDLKKLVNYDALIFPYAANLPNTIRDKVSKNLFAAVYKHGIGIITADNFLTNDERNAPVMGDSYALMKQLLGVTRDNGAGPVSVDVTANDIAHPAMKGYAAGEAILSSQTLNTYKNTWASYYQAILGQPANILANLTLSGVGVKPGVIATTTGGRNVHFATTGLMADGNLVWQALQWVVYGTQTPIGLKMGRNNNLFISRNDMDQSQEYGDAFFDSMGKVDVPLYPILQQWKQNYNFIGSYYINIGNTPPSQKTSWESNPPKAFDAKPLYQKYIALGNEIGTHSYTHPHDTNSLTPTELEFEFNQSMNQIAANLNPTWNNQAIRGAAVPGAPENVNTAHNILQYVDYLSGGGSMIGAGYPSAIGYLTAADTKVYFSPNMSFDFTLMDFGVPMGSPPVPTRLTATQAESYWAAEYDRLMKHAAQPIVHWAWHDYGPTSATTATSGQGYSVAMFENTIKKAYRDGSEFMTLADAAQRINTFKNAKLTVTQHGSNYLANVAAQNVGKFSLALNLPAGQKIQRVGNWYAYNEDKVFLKNDGGTYEIQTGTTVDPVTHIVEMPQGSKIISLTGDGVNLQLTFEGSGWVKYATGSKETNKGGQIYEVLGDGSQLPMIPFPPPYPVMVFGDNGKPHTLSIKLLADNIFPPKTTGLVTVFSDTYYRGIDQSFPKEGVYTFAAGDFNLLGDNNIASMSIPKNYQVKACENADGTGQCVVYDGFNPMQQSTFPGLPSGNMVGMLGKVSYLKIGRVGTV